MLKKLLALLTIFASASYIDVTVESGDTFNTILRRHNVSTLSINQINASAKRIPLISSLNPKDKLQLYVDSTNQRLVSAYIEHKNQNYVLNRDKHSFKTHPLSSAQSVKVVTTHSDENTLETEKLIAQRAAKTLFPDLTGMIQVALDGKTPTVIKITTDAHTQYGFLHTTNGLPVYTDANGSMLSPAISRAPTEYKRISSHFNPKRLHPISKKILPHNGVDLAAPINTPVWAAADGVVVHKSDDTGYGNMLVIQHKGNIQTLYAHLNKYHNNISVGQKVHAFETIAYIGSTGNSTGYHLHFEIKIDGVPLDPMTVELPSTAPSAPLSQPYYF